ncbi:MAG: hypothetical protein RMK29_18190 [Myxococcales bacterium]|nr:hypothetical protein [Myxococcota bacterium]MDW8283642.1 hypothetical protein [Myxococcales bacterium]
MAKTQFRSFGIKVPTDWRQPQGNVAARQYSEAFSAQERAVPPLPMPPALFLAASSNKYHTDTQKKLSDQFTAYIDGICGAICSAWSQWQRAATLVGVSINAMTASGGQVVGPPWMPLIMASAPMSSPMEVKYSTAIALAIDTGWTAYQASIKVPGLPWYPAFAAFPAPVAPPTPNVPVPVAALAQVTAPISKSALMMSMIANFGDPTALHQRELFDSIADAFEKCFQTWQTTTQVTNVMGTGPVPSFAPPLVPAGPVLGGVGIMAPGGFT